MSWVQYSVWEGIKDANHHDTYKYLYNYQLVCICKEIILRALSVELHN